MTLHINPIIKLKTELISATIGVVIDDKNDEMELVVEKKNDNVASLCIENNVMPKIAIKIEEYFIVGFIQEFMASLKSKDFSLIFSSVAEASSVDILIPFLNGWCGR